jgi:hypothetical protein
MFKDSSITNKIDSKRVKWDVIFLLREFKHYLSRSEFIEISSLNQLLREKLKYKALYKVKFNLDFLFQFPNYFYREEFEVESEIDNELEAIKSFQCNRIDPFIDELVKGLNTFDFHLKQIEFDRLYRQGYFIVPLVSNFAHLSSLSIYDCDLELKSFNKLVLKLEKLKFLYLNSVEFVILAEEWHLDHGNLLPSTLEVLQLGYMSLRKEYYKNAPYNFLLNNTSEYMMNQYYIPPQHLPNLKKLSLSIDTKYYISYFPNLLDLNPQLTHISTPYYHLSPKAVRYLSEANTINEMHIIFKADHYEFKSLDYMLLNSLNALYFESIISSHYDKVYSLISLCPRLTKLHASLEYYSEGFIEKVLKKLDHLKVIELEIENFMREEFDLSIFSNIESLKLNISSIEVIRYILPTQLSKLRSIKLSSNEYIESFDIMLGEYNNSTIWNIKLIGNAIHCRTIAI